jgi:hypothetical protein
LTPGGRDDEDPEVLDLADLIVGDDVHAETDDHELSAEQIRTFFSLSLKQPNKLERLSMSRFFNYENNGRLLPYPETLDRYEKT